jgi:hypothetical protein
MKDNVKEHFINGGTIRFGRQTMTTTMASRLVMSPLAVDRFHVMK